MKTIAKVALVAVAAVALSVGAASVHAATWAQATLGINCQETLSNGYRYSGIKVTGVAYNSAAAQAGIEAGDIITHVNGYRVRTYDQLQNAIMDDSDGYVVIHVDNVRQPGTLGSTALWLN